jgi:hypothetical protein
MCRCQVGGQWTSKVPVSYICAYLEWGLSAFVRIINNILMQVSVAGGGATVDRKDVAKC